MQVVPSVRTWSSVSGIPSPRNANLWALLYSVAWVGHPTDGPTERWFRKAGFACPSYWSSGIRFGCGRDNFAGPVRKIFGKRRLEVLRRRDLDNQNQQPAFLQIRAGESSGTELTHLAASCFRWGQLKPRVEKTTHTEAANWSTDREYFWDGAGYSSIYGQAAKLQRTPSLPPVGLHRGKSG